MQSRGSSHWLVSQDPFWPRIDLLALRHELGLAETVSETRLQLAALSAVWRVAQVLADCRRTLRAQGYRHLEDLPLDEGAGQQLLGDYQQAVRLQTQRELLGSVQVLETTRGGRQ